MEAMTVVRDADIEPVHEQVHLEIGLLAITIASGVVIVEGELEQQALSRENNRVGNRDGDVAREFGAVHILTDQRTEGFYIVQADSESAQRLRLGLIRQQVDASPGDGA